MRFRIAALLLAGWIGVSGAAGPVSAAVGVRIEKEAVEQQADEKTGSASMQAKDTVSKNQAETGENDNDTGAVLSKSDTAEEPVENDSSQEDAGKIPSNTDSMQGVEPQSTSNTDVIQEAEQKRNSNTDSIQKAHNTVSDSSEKEERADLDTQDKQKTQDVQDTKDTPDTASMEASNGYRLFGIAAETVWREVDRIAEETRIQAAEQGAAEAEYHGIHIPDTAGRVEDDEEPMLGVSDIWTTAETFQVVRASSNAADEGKNNDSLFLGGGAYVYDGVVRNIMVKIIQNTNYLAYCNDMIVTDFGPVTRNDEYYTGSPAEFAGLCYIYGNGAQEMRKKCVNAAYSTGNAFFDYQVTQMAVWMYLNEIDRSKFGGSGDGTKLTLEEFIQIQGKAQALADDAVKYRSTYTDAKGYHDGNDIQVTPAATRSAPDTMTLNGNYFYSKTFKVTVRSDFGEMKAANVINDMRLNTNTAGAVIIDKNPSAGTFRIRIPKAKVPAGGVTVSVSYNPNLKYYRAARYTPPAGTWPSTYQRIGFLVRDGADPTQMQVFAKAVLPAASASVKKTSANTAVTGNSACYSLNGAQYSMYTNAGCTTAAKTTAGANAVFKIDEKGSSNTLQLAPGTYYMKETVRPKGYQLDTEVKKVVLEAGKTNTIAVKEQPIVGEFPLTVEKVREDNGKADQAFAGIRFRVCYYSGSWEYTNRNLPAAADRTWIIQTAMEKNQSIARLLQTNLVEGDSLFFSDGKLPLGTYTVSEIRESVPEGFGWNPDIYFYHLKDENGKTAVTENKTASSLKDYTIRIPNPSPAIRTEASNPENGSQYLPASEKEVRVKDTILYSGLQPDSEYNVEGRIMEITDGGVKETGIQAFGSFKTGTAKEGVSVSGTYEGMEFLLTPVKYANRTLVVYERLYLRDADGSSGKLAAAHEDPTDRAQMLFVTDFEPHKTVNRVSNAFGMKHCWDITAGIPLGFGNAEKRAFIIEDRFDSRLDYCGVESLRIDESSETLTKADYTITEPVIGSAGGIVRIEFTESGLKKLGNNEGKNVHLAIETSINATAETAVNIPNKAGVYVEADGYSETKMTEEPYVYTGQIRIRKVDEDGNTLAGVGLQLFTEHAGTMYPVILNNGKDPVCYSEDGYSEKGTPYILYTDEQGIAAFMGLRDGEDYAVREIAAARGMELLTESVRITVKNGKANDGKLLEIVNGNSLHLKTGGEGRTIWYAICMLILLAGVSMCLWSAHKRKQL